MLVIIGIIGLLGLGFLFTVYCCGEAKHWAPGDPEPSVRGFFRELLEVLLNH